MTTSPSALPDHCEQARDAVLAGDEALLTAAVHGLLGADDPDSRMWSALCRLVSEEGPYATRPDEVPEAVVGARGLASEQPRLARAAASAVCAYRLVRERLTDLGMREAGEAIVLLDPWEPTADACVAAELVGQVLWMLTPSARSEPWTVQAIAAAESGGYTARAAALRVRVGAARAQIADGLDRAGRSDEAAAMWAGALAAFEEAEPIDGDQGNERAVFFGATLVALGRIDEARPLLERAMVATDPWFANLARIHLARAARCAGDADSAAAAAEAAVASFRATGDRRPQSWALDELAAALEARGDLAGALAASRESGRLLHQVLLDVGGELGLAVEAQVQRLAATAEANSERRRALLLARRAGDLETAALTDALTGLANRRGFDEALDRVREIGEAVAIAIIDVDHFKAVNDLHNHLVGDEVLRRVAIILRSHVRASDVVARWAGDEFVALLPRVDAEHAAGVLERFRIEVATHPWAEVGTDLHVTVSVGVAAGDGTEGTTDTFRRADDVLFRLKRAGRNRVAYDPDGCATVGD